VNNKKKKQREENQTGVRQKVSERGKGRKRERKIARGTERKKG
jgi:hypothetical protein